MSNGGVGPAQTVFKLARHEKGAVLGNSLVCFFIKFIHFIYVSKDSVMYEL